MHLTPEVENALHSAIDDARRRGHREVTPVHLLATLPQSFEPSATLPRLAQIRALRALIQQHLAGIEPEPGGYRAGVESQISDALESSLRHSSQLFGLMTATVDDVFQALREDGTINGMLEEAQLGIERIDHVFRRCL